ncbi:MAG: hypothetical protein IJ628_09045 [Bacteroidaceae bacterium]|nr:hypothetical protein [Bacteroidaceae bacterium]
MIRHFLYILGLGTALCITGCQGYQRWFEDQMELDTMDESTVAFTFALPGFSGITS